MLQNENQKLKEKVVYLESTFEQRVKDKINKEREEFDQNERIRKQSIF